MDGRISGRSTRDLLRALAIACAALFVSASIAISQSATAPDFSWEHVPVFAHLSKTNGDFTPAEAKFLTDHYSLVTIEKAQGYTDHGSTEEGTRIAVSQLKRANPRVKVLTYWNAFIDYDNLYGALKQPMPAAWFLDVRHMVGGTERRLFNVANPDFRAWWVRTAANLATSTGADGIFVDAVPQIAAEPDRLRAHYGQAEAAALISGAKQMLADLQSRLGPARLLIFNGLRSIPGGWPDGGSQFLAVSSGAMVEHFAYLQNSSPELIAADIDLIRSADTHGKIVLVKAWPDAQSESGSVSDMPGHATENLDFPLACFLIAAGEHTYFGYSWGYREDDGWLQTYAQFGRRLGVPLGSAVRNGWVYRRQFAHARVLVDLAAHKGTIVWQ